MRNLRFLRRKSFVASLAKLQVWIEDHENSEMTIRGVPCRKLGYLKNGEEAVFEIDNNAHKVFVICDKLSKEYCFDLVRVREGDNDLFFQGQNKFNTAAGNAFRFDGVTDPEVLATRKKGSAFGTIITIAAIVIGFLVGFFLL